MIRTLFIFLFSAFAAVAQQPLLSIKTDLDHIEEGWINLTTIQHGNAFSGIAYSRADSAHCFGIGYEKEVAEVLQNKNLNVLVKGHFRAFQPEHYQLVFMVSNKDSLIYWTAVDIGKNLTDTNWTSINVHFSLPKNITVAGNTLKTFVWNSNCRNSIDADDFGLEFFEEKMPSFLPVIKQDKKQMVSSKNILSTKYFSVLYDEEKGFLSVRNSISKDSVLYSNFSLLLQSRSDNEVVETETDVYSSFSLVKKTDTSATFLVSASKADVQVEFIAEHSSALTCNVISRIKKYVQVIRFSAVVDFDQPFSEMINQSGERIMYPATECWTKRTGFISGSGTKKICVFHPDVSSVQLDPTKNRAVFNLDFSADHPMLHFPLMDSSFNKFVDVSESIYRDGDVIKGSFTFFYSSLNALPIVSAFPSKYQSAMIWTEHADFSDIRTQRAVYFGADSILQKDHATGGFMKWKIPVTKSIFFANPTHELISRKHGAFNSESANYSATPGFREFLLELRKNGVEVCLHTPDPFTTSRKNLEAALKKMNAEFKSPSWIDHGYDNGRQSNREDLNCDGSQKGSPYYAADLWKKYGVIYFWNSFFEDSSVYESYAFNAFCSKPYHGYGDQFPVPVYWKHPTRTGDIIHWRTTGTTDPPDPSFWSYYFSEQKLNDLVQSHGTEIIHCYAPRVDSTNGYYRISTEGVFIDPIFDQLLQLQSQYRDNHKIWLTTVEGYLNYQLALDRLEYTVAADGIITIYNKNKNPVSGLTITLLPGMYSLRFPDMTINSSQTDVIEIPQIEAGSFIQLVPYIR